MEHIRAAVMVAPGRMEVREFPRPKMSEGLLVKVELAGICGTDKHNFSGQNRQYVGTPHETSTPFPIIPGHENVGTIVEIFNRDHRAKDFNGNSLKVGDRITMCPDVVCGECWYCRNTFGYPWCENMKGYGNAFSCDEPPHLMGGWAEMMYITPKTFIYKVPETIPIEVAMLSELFTVTAGLESAKECFSLANLGFGSFPTVVVFGVGPLGLCCVIKSRLMGAGRIIAIDRSAYRLKAARKFGADEMIDTHELDEAARRELVRSLTSGRGADVVVGCAGEAETFPEGLNLLRNAGTYIEIGIFVDSGDSSVNVSRQVCTKNARIIGICNHPFTEYANTHRIFEKYGDQIPFKELVSHVYPLERAQEALQKSMELESLKVALKPTRP